MTGSNQPRKQRGQPGGGEWAVQRRAEAHLGGPLIEDHPPNGPGGGRRSQLGQDDQYEDLTPEVSAALEGAASARSPDELEEYVGHSNPYVRAEVAGSLHLSADQARRLVDDPDWSVRLQIARRNITGLSEVLSRDPDEVIRAQCLGDPNLDVETRTRLNEDEAVNAMFARLSNI